MDFQPKQGAAYVFQRESPTSDRWTEIQKLTASDGGANDDYGSAVALYDQTSIVGAPRREGDGSPLEVHDFGGVYLYDIEPAVVACQPAFPPTDTLENGATITRPSGFALSAPADTLSAPLAVWLNEVGPPAVPLFSDLAPLGAYYNVGTRCTAAARAEKSFVLELPCPTRRTRPNWAWRCWYPPR